MSISFIDDKLEQVYQNVLSNSRLSKEDGICIYKTNDLLGLGHIANHVRRSRHGNKAFYI
jgi:aminodeoxyfutalosine synthase